MNNQTEIKGAMSTRFVGVLIIFYAVIVFVTSLLASDTFTFATGILLIVSAIAILLGIGLLNLNFYAWCCTMGITIIAMFSGIFTTVQYFLQPNINDVTSPAINLLWPVVFFCLLLSSFNACRVSKNTQRGWMLRQLPVLAAAVITILTVLSLKVSGNEGFLFLGFPVLVIEFGLIYTFGLFIQKKFGWTA